jgi:SAM-dependent methyltransferase
VLELGGGYGGETCRELILKAGLQYFATDLQPAPGVDFVADFESSDIAAHLPARDFGCVLVLNVLEHVFEPIRVLDNALAITRRGGRVVTITPCQWPVHDYPIDCQRLLADWYCQYARRRSDVTLLERYFDYVGFGPVSNFADRSTKALPPPTTNRFKSMYSRAIHKVFRTTGRGGWSANHVAIGAVFERQ